MEPVSAAVVGAGSHGRVHALGQLAAPGVSLVALADVDERAAGELAAEMDVAHVHHDYRDYRELLDVHRPDVLSVCTPPAPHPEIVRAAIAAGVRAVHCEKPVALSYGEALEMAALAANAAEHALHGAELVFATDESSRSRRRVLLPLDRLDNALLSGLAAGYWNPAGELRSTY